jgi:phosphoglycolate phosphatase-like HAD superfamily hydrolase
MSKKLIIFDIDGTLTNTNKVDHQSFIKTYADLYDIHVEENMWEHCEHYTDTGIAQHVFDTKIGRPMGPVDMRKIKKAMVDNLMSFMEENESAFDEVKGAYEIIELLKTKKEYALAIATGCWEDTATLKLNIAGLDYDEIPLANSDHSISRVGIIEKAIELSQEKNGVKSFDKIIYIGDGIWDVKATNEKNIPLIGIDCNNSGALAKAGVKTIFKDFSDQKAFLKAIEEL